MLPWIYWLCAAGVLVILELLTGTFYLLMVALGLLVGAVAAYFGASVIMQFLTASIAGAIATICLNRSQFGTTLLTSPAPASGQNPNLDIGQSVQVDVWHHHDEGPATARIMYRGALWDSELIDAAAPRPVSGMFYITAMRGSCLLLSAAPPIFKN